MGVIKNFQSFLVLRLNNNNNNKKVLLSFLLLMANASLFQGFFLASFFSYSYLSLILLVICNFGQESKGNKHRSDFWIYMTMEQGKVGLWKGSSLRLMPGIYRNSSSHCSPIGIKDNVCKMGNGYACIEFASGSIKETGWSLQ